MARRSSAPPPALLEVVHRPVTSVEATAAALRDAIAKGMLKPGDRIKEIPVAAALGLSRGPVRDALRLLAEEGLVRLVANQGATVAEVHAADFMELYGLRVMLGKLAIRALVHGSADLSEPRAQADRLATAVRRRRVAEAVDADLCLQDALVRSSGLSRTAVLFSRITLQLRVYVGIVGVDYQPVLQRIYDEDVHLLDAVERRDAPAAIAAWHEKLEGWARDFVLHLDEDFDATAWLAVYAPV